MKLPHWRTISAISALLFVVLLATSYNNWRTLQLMEQENSLAATLGQAASDSARLRSAAQQASVSALDSSPAAAIAYKSQKRALENLTGRITNQLQPFPALHNRATMLQQQTQALLTNLDALAIVTADGPQFRPLPEQLQATIATPLALVEQQATDLESVTQAEISTLSGIASPQAIAGVRQVLDGTSAAFLLLLAICTGIIAQRLRSSSTETARERTQELHSAVFRSSPQMIVTCDLRGNITSINPAAASLLGDREANVLERRNRISDFLVAGQWERWTSAILGETQAPVSQRDGNETARIRQVISHLENADIAESKLLPLQFRRSDGSAFAASASFAPLRKGDGKAVGLIVMTGDPAPLASEAETNEKYRSILNATAEGIFKIAPLGVIDYANPTAAALLKQHDRDIIFRDLHAMLHGNRPGGLAACAGRCNLLRGLQAGEAFTGQDILFYPGGTGLPIEFSTAPVRENGRLVGAVCSVRDITQRFAMQRAKDEFVSTVSHELRTPLTSIRGALGLLSNGILGGIPEKASELLRIAIANTDRLMRLINEVLDLERLESDLTKLQFRKLNLQELIQQAIDTMRPMADSAGIHLQLNAQPCECEIDPDKIVQVFTNLLSNAVKFSGRGSQVTIAISPADEIVSISVSDQGRGIPEDQLENVFDRFRQVDRSDASQKGGSGLGLAICRTILQQHGGRIWAERNEPQGVTFRMVVPRSQTVTMPMMMSQQRASAQLPLLESAVLVCDDDPIARSMVRHHLQRHGYRIYEAESGEQAVELARSHNFELILLDIFMPGMNGWETLEKLKSDKATAEIPVVILSVFSPRPVASSQNIRGWVSKPFNEHSLLTALGSALNHGAGNSKILLVEDDNDHAAQITRAFERAGLAVHHARNRTEALEMSQRVHPDLMVLNLAIRGGEGMKIVSWLRQHNELHGLPLVVYSGGELSNADIDVLAQGPTKFLVEAKLQPEEVAQLVTTSLSRHGEHPSNYMPAPPVYVPRVDGRGSAL